MKNKKIAIITTGGTAGSVLQKNLISIDNSGKKIISEIKKLEDKIGYSFSVKSIFNKNSENFSPKDWGIILNALSDANNSDVDGIVVTHGTDTLVYTVSAALAYGNLWNKRICFTGSYYSPDHPSSDISLNLLAALKVSISHYPTGIYVAFRSNELNTEAQIISGENLKPMSFDDLYFKAVYNKKFSTFSLKNGLSKDELLTLEKTPSLGVNFLPNVTDIETAQRDVCFITIYPGIDKSALETIAKNKKIIVLKMYHSGTGPAASDNDDLVNFIRNVLPNTTVLMGTFPKNNIDSLYKSTNLLKDAGGHIYFNIQPCFLYVFSILALSVGLDSSSIIKRLFSWEL